LTLITFMIKSVASHFVLKLVVFDIFPYTVKNLHFMRIFHGNGKC